MTTCVTCNWAVNDEQADCKRCDLCFEYDMYEENNNYTSTQDDTLVSNDCGLPEPPAIYRLLLKALLGTEGLAVKWWTTPNKAFSDDTPMSYHNAGGEKEMDVAQYVLGMLNR